MFNTTISNDTINLVSDTLKSTFISAGKKVDEFELALSKWVGKTVTVNSGTSALHLSLVSAGIGQGDEVILPAQTFIATGLAILQVGAKPIFVDIDYMCGNMDVNSIKEKITENTKAIIPVHWGGYPCDMDEITKIARLHNLIVIEDAAHAFGATYKNQPIGHISEYTCFSFQAIKLLTTGDGGAITTTNNETIKRLKKLRWFNIDRDDDTPDILGERVYNSNEIGYKYHMNDIVATIGLGNIRGISEKLIRHKQISTLYRNNLKNIGGVSLFDKKDDRISSNWLFGLHVEKREDFIKKLKSNDISSSVIHLGIDKNILFGGKDESLLNQRKFDNTQIHIPIHNGLSDEDVHKIVNTIKSGW